MRYVNGAIGLTFLVLTVLSAANAQAHLSCVAMLGVATVLAFLTFVPSMPIPLARVLAIATVGTMFYFFAGFFTMASNFDSRWYTQAASFEAVAFLLTAFCLLAVLSDYSCRLKADCPLNRARTGAQRKGFFTVPSELQKQIS